MNKSEPIKVVVSTFNNSKSNYGAVLQACALSWKLTSMGYDVTYVSLQNRINKIASQKNSTVQQIKKVIASVLSLTTKKKREQRAKKFEAFVKCTQKLVFYETYEELIKSPPIADVYISGSDQVWNATNIHDELFLSFAPEGKKRISYAASMGNEYIPKEHFALFSEYISRYDSISVREDTMVDIIKPFTNKKIYQHIDPVFLKTKNEWEKLEKPYSKLKYKEYILLYFIEWDTKNNAKIEKLKKETGLPTVAIALGGWCRRYADQTIFDASPEEFLYLLHHAKMVVTSSFHGTALSIIYHKPLITYSGKVKPSRIESLLRHYGLTSHNTLDFSWEQAQVDYEAIDKQIEIDRLEAEQYLRNSIEK